MWEIKTNPAKAHEEMGSNPSQPKTADFQRQGDLFIIQTTTSR